MAIEEEKTMQIRHFIITLQIFWMYTLSVITPQIGEMTQKNENLLFVHLITN